MKYIYTNVTDSNQTVLLATKNQDTVGSRTFTPGAHLELDYPGLNMYVPNTLSCIVLDITTVAPKIAELPVLELAPKIEQIVPTEPIIVDPVVELTDEPVIESIDAPTVDNAVELVVEPIVIKTPITKKAKK